MPGVLGVVNLRAHGPHAHLWPRYEQAGLLVYVGWAQRRATCAAAHVTSPWANPYRIGRDGSRDEVIARYRDEHLPSRPDLLELLPTLRGRVLGCWCAPLPCHADVLLALGRA